jgi:hypothetical protein
MFDRTAIGTPVMIETTSSDRRHGKRQSAFPALVIASATLLLATGPLLAQAQDPTGIKRAFLDRYLDCAEAPGDAARLACYDALLIDIPAWLDDPNASGDDTLSTRTKGASDEHRLKLDCPRDIKSE